MTRAETPLLVVSDAHLGAEGEDHEKLKSGRLHAFWEYVLSEGADLVVLGDLFDFWFEYRHAVPAYHLDHLWALKRIVQAGRRVWYVAGNHDFWAGRFFTEEIGLDFRTDELRLERFGRRILLAHGDGWLPEERGYRLMRRVLRHPLGVGFYRLISPDIGIPLARWVSGRSRGQHDLDPAKFAKYAGVARNRLVGYSDLLITAHLHVARHIAWPSGDWITCGDWMRHFTFVRMDSDGAQLLRWYDTGRHERIAPEPVAELQLESMVAGRVD